MTAAYAALCEECGDTRLPVAVRSSATSEDSAEASFAGLQDTYLWVHGADSVLDHVRRCWASLYSVESVTYRLRRGIPEDDLGMAVVVQRMVGARSSGVMFTRSPLTGDRSVVAIDASWGLGSAVVSGDVTPDSFVVSKVTGEVPADRRHQDPLAPARPVGHGVVETDVPADLQDRPSLSDEEIAELVAIARRVEAHYGCPQDIEWAVAERTGGETSSCCRAGPETVWAAKDAAPRRPPRPPRGRSTTCSTCWAASARRRADVELTPDDVRDVLRVAGLQRPRRAAPGARRPDADRAPRGRGRAGRRNSRCCARRCVERRAAPAAADRADAGPGRRGRGAGRRAPTAAGHLLPGPASRARRRSWTSATR